MEDELNRLKGDHKMSVKEILSRTMQYVKPELLSFILAIVLLAINVDCRRVIRAGPMCRIQTGSKLSTATADSCTSTM